MARVPIQLPNSARITLIPTNEFYALSGLNEILQPCDVVLNIIKSDDPEEKYPDGVTIILPLIASLNFRTINVTINFSDAPVKVRILAFPDESNKNSINGSDNLPCVNNSGYQVFSVIGTEEWQSLAEITAYNKVIDGETGIKLPARDTLEFKGANVVVSDDAMAQKTIVTINP